LKKSMSSFFSGAFSWMADTLGVAMLVWKIFCRLFIAQIFIWVNIVIEFSISGYSPMRYFPANLLNFQLQCAGLLTSQLVIIKYSYMDHLGHSCTCTCHITQMLWVYLHCQLQIVLHLHYSLACICLCNYL
jgi:hypothetical protein